MQKITKQSLDEMAMTMPFISLELQQYYVGGNESLQCLINSMVSASSSNGYFEPKSCGVGSQHMVNGTISINGQTFTIDVTSGATTYHPQVESKISGTHEKIADRQINGEQAYRFKFRNKTAPSAEMFGVWIVVPESAVSVFDSYFSR